MLVGERAAGSRAHTFIKDSLDSVWQTLKEASVAGNWKDGASEEEKTGEKKKKAGTDSVDISKLSKEDMLALF